MPRPRITLAVTVAGIGLTEPEAIRLINQITDQMENHHVHTE